jgi:Lipocalin-like domain
MKKSLLLLVFAIAFVGCKPKQTVVNTKLDYKAASVIKGDWNVTNVSYPGSDYIKVTSFDIADSKCFVGSVWNFIPNNNKGNMALNNSSCTSFTSPITWYINKDGDFVMKIINETKSKKVTEGYVLKVANISENSFQLIDKINVGGKLVDVVYEFQKSN